MAQRFKAKTLISNSGVFNNELTAPNLVYNTGNQNISGVKNFYSRLTINGTGILISGEAGQVDLSSTVRTTGDQTISGNKTFENNLILNSGLIFTDYINDGQDVDIDLLSRPYSNTRVSIGTQTAILGQSINSLNTEREIKIWESGGAYTQFSKGPFVRIGASGVLISEKTESKVGIGTLFPTEKVHISGGNLKVEGNAIANNLVYNTGNQNISGKKSFQNQIEFLNSTSTFPFYPTISGRGSDDSEAELDIDAFKLNLRAGYNKSEYIELGGEEGRLNINTVADTSTFNLGTQHNASSNLSYSITSPTINLYGQVSGQTGTFQRLTANNLVYNTGNQTISGVKIFNNSPIINALSSFPASSDGYVGRNPDGSLSLYGTGQTTTVPAFYGWDGFTNNSFTAATARTNLGLTSTATAAEDSFVRTTGNQNISGIKTFNDPIYGTTLSGLNLIGGVPTSIGRSILISGGNGTSFGGGSISIIGGTGASIYPSGTISLRGSTINLTASTVEFTNSPVANASAGFINVTSNFTINAAYGSDLVLANSSSQITGTISSGLANGFNVSIHQIGSGQIVITGAGTGVIINSYGNQYKTAGQYAAISLVHTGNNGYLMYGNTAL